MRTHVCLTVVMTIHQNIYVVCMLASNLSLSHLVQSHTASMLHPDQIGSVVSLITSVRVQRTYISTARRLTASRNFS